MLLRNISIFFEGKINSTLLGQELNDRINASALRSEVERLEDEINQQIESDIAEVTRKIGETENSLARLVRKKMMSCHWVYHR
ncbi:hypothetical protein ACLB1E_25380 [Escherichia coli]